MNRPAIRNGVIRPFDESWQHRSGGHDAIHESIAGLSQTASDTRTLPTISVAIT